MSSTTNPEGRVGSSYSNTTHLDLWQKPLTGPAFLSKKIQQGSGQRDLYQHHSPCALQTWQETKGKGLVNAIFRSQLQGYRARRWKMEGRWWKGEKRAPNTSLCLFSWHLIWQMKWCSTVTSLLSHFLRDIFRKHS